MSGPAPEHLRKDLVRLVAGLDMYRDWRIATAQAVLGPDHVPNLDELVAPGQFWLDGFDAKPRQGAFWLKEVRNWYSHTASEFADVLKTGAESDKAAVRAFLESFSATLGFDFMAESGALRDLATRVLKRGHIATAEEYEDLAEIESNVPQSILGDEEIRTLRVLLAEFEKAR